MDTNIIYNPQTKVISRKETISIELGGLGHRFYNSMKQNQKLLSQIDAKTGQCDTFHTILTKSIRTSIEMKRQGIKVGDIITICSYNQPNSIIPFIAAQFLGSIVAPIDPTIELEDIRYLLNIVKPAMIFISEDCEEWIEMAVNSLGDLKIITFGESDKFSNFKDFLKPTDREDGFRPIFLKNGNATAAILFSSGTTGFPKGICLSHNFLTVNCHNITNAYPKMKILLSYASLYWISTVLFVMLHIEEGCARLLCDKFDANLFWEYVDKYQVDVTMLPPSQAIRCYKVRPTCCSNTSLKYISIGGSSISPIYVDRIRKSLPNTTIRLGYGLTEVGIVALGLTKLNAQKLYTVGFPQPGFQYKIVDLDTEKPLGFNQVGELRIKSSYPMNGYYNKDSTDCYDDDGFLKTGDLLYYDEDFCLYVTDRVKEMFKYLSWHILPAKLEAVLEKHKDVEIAAVVGIPHNEDDHHAVGVVVLQEGAYVTVKELQTFVDGQVDDRNRLRGGIRIVKSLPYTPSGKIIRRQIRDMIVAGQVIS